MSIHIRKMPNLEVLQTEPLPPPVLPAEQHRHLVGGDLEVVGAVVAGEGDGAVGHVVVPTELAAAVLPLEGKSKKLIEIWTEQAFE